MRARHLSNDHRVARLVGALAIALGVALLVFVLTSDEVDDGSSSDGASPTTEATDATVLGEVIEGTTLPDAPPASAVAFTTTTDTGRAEGGSGGTSGDGPSRTNPTSTTTPPPTIGPPVSVTRPPTTTTAPTTTTTTPTTTTTEPTTTTTEPE